MSFKKAESINTIESTLTENDFFCFNCHNSLKCFNQCCSKIDLFLTPYDIIRLKNNLMVDSREFMERYAHAIYKEEVGHPLVVMKMLGDEKRCPFSRQEGCLVYEDRPWSCRSYPLEPCSNPDSAENSAQAYMVVKQPFCLGFTSKSDITVKQWLEQQGSRVFEEMNAIWSRITLSKNFPDGGLGQTEIQMFYLASYSHDEFRALVTRDSFLANYGLKIEDIEKIIDNDIAFYQFACNWLRVVILKEDVPLIAS